MKFNKEAFKLEAKELLKKDGKEQLAEFVEDVSMMGWELIKLAAKHTEEFSIDDMIVSAMDGKVTELIDAINEAD